MAVHVLLAFLNVRVAEHVKLDPGDMCRVSMLPWQVLVRLYADLPDFQTRKQVASNQKLQKIPVLFTMALAQKYC